MTRHLVRLTLAGLALAPVAATSTEPAGRLAYLKDGVAWVEGQPGSALRPVPNSRGSVLLDLSPVDGTLAFLTGPPGTNIHAAEVPPLKPFLSAPPYTGSVPLTSLVPGPTFATVRARWLRWEGDGHALIAGTDEGNAGWNTTKRKTFLPNQSALYQSTSRNGAVTALLGSVQSPEDVGVLLYGPGARPGTEVFTRRHPENLMNALRAAPEPGIRKFLGDLDPRAQADDVSWTVTAPKVTQGGGRMYFASNAGYGVGSAGTTTSAVFEVDVRTLRLRVLGWLGTLAGSVLEVLPSPDGGHLLVLLARHDSNARVDTFVYAADLGRRSVRELAVASAPKGTLSILDSACWLADSRQVALSVAYARPQDLNEKNGFEPPAGAYTLFVKDAGSGKTLRRVSGATGVTCGPK
ncbi:hypothetical protein DAETH_39260 (plasmid) [Deinococcus aetherius]|uniref:Uncharacterized protein n=1 Tax=Deinococcus aetherius TaxID=200252 RepID=A0ABM8AJF9_9DEIO|nr:hypothetical protein [Deinococcus aetherius]BDP43957.1 hypothetical protein DAETH_39260 [Deinococcus aetherius]